HLVAYQHTACFQRLVPGESPLLAVQLARGGNAGAVITPRILHHRGGFHREAHRLRNSPQREFTLHAILVLADGLNVGRLEEHRGVALHVEEIRGTQVRVALVNAGVNARHVNSCFNALNAAVFTNLNIAIENLELSTNGGDAKVPYTKL